MSSVVNIHPAQHLPAPAQSSVKAQPILPGSWLGILGGGQLGRMFCMAAQSMGYRVTVLDPDADNPAAGVADQHIQADYLDEIALAQLAARCVAVTTEFENVPAQALQQLALSCQVSPAAAAVQVVQNRITEKNFLSSHQVAVAPYHEIYQASDFDRVPSDIWPAILKAARLGYDGKGQVRVTHVEQAKEAFQKLGNVPCVLEQQLNLLGECSLVLARGLNGEIALYPLVENVHHHGILATTTAPADFFAENSPPGDNPGWCHQAQSIALQIAQGLNYVGVLCVEFFLVRQIDGHIGLLVNEIAPRPHNSGHYTLNACYVSQFEQQVRALTGLPLGSTEQKCPAVMLNLLGDLWFSNGKGRLAEPDWAQVLLIPGACLHLYGKTQARPGRKMGHITCLGASPAQARACAQQVADVLGLSIYTPHT